MGGIAERNLTVEFQVPNEKEMVYRMAEYSVKYHYHLVRISEVIISYF